MIEFLRNAFRQCFTAVQVITLIGSIIICTVMGGEAGEGSGAFIGFLVGAVLGLVMVILEGGMTATFLNMDEKLQSIDESLRFLVAAAKNNGGGAKTDSGAMPDSAVTMSDDMSAPPLGMSDAPKDSALIKSEQTLSGVIRRNNGQDLYHVVLKQPGKLSILVTTDDEEGLPNWESNVKVLGANDRTIVTSGKFGFPYGVEVDLPNAGIYVIEVTSSKTGRYYLSVQY